jgi:sugar phosphate isomerase/epimerase
MKLVMHSYTFRSNSLEEAYRNARRFGWEAIELQPCHFDAEDVINELPRCAALGDRLGVPIHCVDFGGNFISDDEKMVEHDIQRVENTITACHAHGIGVINGGVGSLRVSDTDYGQNGSALATDVHYDRATAALRHLAPFAAERGVRIVLEVHMNTIHDTLAATKKLLDMVGYDNVQANPDPGNMYSTSTAEDDPEALDLLDGRVGYMHFKNCLRVAGAYSYDVKLADGNIDTYKWIAKLVKMGYDDAVCVEYCGAGDPRPAAEQDAAYVKRCLDWAREG